MQRPNAMQKQNSEQKTQEQGIKTKPEQKADSNTTSKARKPLKIQPRTTLSNAPVSPSVDEHPFDLADGPADQLSVVNTSGTGIDLGGIWRIWKHAT